MVLGLLNKKGSEERQGEVGLAEAHYLWHMCKAKYDFREHVGVCQNNVHDKDLKGILKLYESELKDDIKTLEDYLRKYGIKGPDGFAPGTHTLSYTDLIRDQLMAQQVFAFAQGHIGMLIKAFRSSTVNDEINALFLDMTRKAIQRLSLIIKYLSLKGWIGKQPQYPNNPSDEHLCAGEALHLWDHLTYRNDNIELTQVMMAFVHDIDFRLLLEEGQKVLIRQASRLEEELRKFGLPMPNSPPNVMPRVSSTDLLDDDSMFRWVFSGIQGALTMHAQALKECTMNDRIRKIFDELLYSEMEMLSKLVKFGKIKGWLNPAPMYVSSHP